MTPPNYKTPPREQWISGIILLILVTIAGIVLGLHETGRRQWLSTYPDTLEVEVEPSSMGAEDPMGEILAELPGVIPMGPREFFTKNNLADKINGKAELYLSAGFQSLSAQRFQLSDDPDLWFEIFHYRMSGAESAFAVFSTQRRESARSLEGIAQGYATANALFLTLGSSYIELIGSGADPKLPAAMETAAQAMARTRGEPPESGDGASPQALFPPDGMIPESLTLLAENVFGFDGLNQVYTAQYQVSDSDLTAFVSSRSHPAEAREMATAYGDFLMEFGGQTLNSAGLPEGCQALDILDLIEVICARKAIFYGVHEAARPDAAGDLIQTMTRHLISLDHEP